MNILIIDTSDANSFVALYTETGYDIRHLDPEKKQSQSLLPTMIELLQKKNLRPTQLDAIYIGNGPGSFTGTRIGVMAAKTLAYASKCPLISFCSLQKYVPQSDGAFCVVSDGKRHGYFALKGVREGSKYSFDTLPRLISKDNLPSEVFCITGDATLPSLGKAEMNIDHLYSAATYAVKRKRFVDPMRLNVTYLTSP